MNEPKDDLGDTISNKKEGSIDRKSIKLEDDISKTEKPFPNYPKTSNENGQHNSTSCCQQIKNKKKKNIWCIIILPIVILFIIVVVVALVLVLKKVKKKKDIVINYPTDIISPTAKPDNPIIEPIEKEFEILTEVGKLKQISVTQKSREQTKLNNYTIIDDYIRKTDYDIYFISEEEAKGDKRLFYTKMYSGVVSIRSECVTEKEDCTPQPLLSLTSVGYNLRFLDNNEKYKDQPIPLCLFNITDNNFITTLTCPESLSDIKKMKLF